MKSAVRLAASAHNTTERVHGYTPAQWAFGRNPTWDNCLFDPEPNSVNISGDASDEIQKKLQQQQTARSIFEKEMLHAKMQRAQRAKHRKDLVFCPGDSVFIWRQIRTSYRVHTKPAFIKVLGMDLAWCLGPSQSTMKEQLFRVRWCG